MADTKYGKYIITELKGPESMMAALGEYARFGKRILWMDTNVVEGAFQMNCSWYLRPTTKGPEPHVHDVDEIIGFFGSDDARPYDLGGEVELWLEDQQFIIDKSVMIFVPAGMKHCPLILRKVDRPIIHFTVVTGGEYIIKDTGGAPVAEEHGQYVVTELKIPEEKQKITAEYNKYARRILWMDEHVVPGAFHLNTAWYLKAASTLENTPHVHEDDDEIIGFIGSNPDDPSDLGGEIELWLDDEQHIITRSAMVFVPAGLKHCPLILRKVDRPIFHFTTVPGKQYIKEVKE